MPRQHEIPFAITQSLKLIGSNIRTARIRRRMSQDELAAKCDTTRRTIYSIEQGHPGASAANVLSALWALGLLSDADALADPDKDEHGKILEAAHQPERVRQSKVQDNDF